jgi:nucleoside-diphosphate-sugar epimerase
MKILVTGAAGRVGRHVAQELLRHGHEVRALDRVALPTDLRPRVEVLYADLTDRLALLRAAQGCDAVVHLAAIPSPMSGEESLFPINVTGTQWVLAAAEAHGIERVVLASSCSAYGFAFAREPFDPQYLPVDENHPLLPQDMYGVSKQLNEQTARAYARRGLTTVCIRMPHVMTLPGERLQWRKRHLTHAFEVRNGDFWSYLAVEDAARAFRMAAEAKLTGFHVFNIAARDAYGRGDVREAVARFYPALTPQVEHLAPDAALYSSQRAREVLGFEAQTSWRDFPELAEDSG